MSLVFIFNPRLHLMKFKKTALSILDIKPYDRFCFLSEKSTVYQCDSNKHPIHKYCLSTHYTLKNIENFRTDISKFIIFE